MGDEDERRGPPGDVGSVFKKRHAQHQDALRRWTSIWSIITEGHVMEMGMDPVHPGECIRESVEAMGWTVGEAATRLGVSRAALSRVLNARAAVSVEMALALETLGWGSADFWVRMQGDYDLTRARRARAA